MKYQRLVTVVTTDPDYCFAGRIEDADGCELKCTDGRPVAHEWPSDPFSVKVNLDRDFRGVKLPSLIGNTRSLLMLHREVVDLFEKELDLGEHERLPFSLVNHKGRTHSKDYVFLNPLGAVDIAAPSSDFMRYPSGGIYGCKAWVLVAAKLKGLPDLVRPKEVPTHYMVSERLLELVAKHELTNFEVTPVALV